MTLIELLIALALFSMIILAASSMQVFGHNQLVTGQRRAKLQNELTILLGHMKRQALRTVGASAAGPANGVAIIALGGYPSLQFYTDTTAAGGIGNGIRDASPPDRWVAYLYRTDLHEVWYYPNAGSASPILFGGAHEVIANGITTIGWAIAANTNLVTLTGLEARWIPAQACGPANPCVVMDSAIYMPSLSTN